jgi:hypothetical protein
MKVKRSILNIVIKPGPGIDPVKGPGLGFHESTRINLKKIKNFIFHMKKNQCEYKLYML